MESRVYAYNVYWLKENVSRGDWKSGVDKETALEELESLLVVTDFDKIREVFERTFPEYPVSGIVNIERLTMPVILQ